MLKKWLALLLSTIFMLAACNPAVYNQTEGNIADVKLKAAAARKTSDYDAKANPSLLVKKGLYVDTTPINLERSPSWLKNHIIIRGDQLPFSYYSRTIARGANNHVLTKYQTGLDQTFNISLNYSGTVKGALDLLAAKTGYIYSVRKGGIYWQAFVTKTFDVSFMPGGTDYLMGKIAGSSSTTANTSSQGTTGTVSNFISSDSSDSEYSNLKGTLSIWKDLDSTLHQLISKDGTIMVSESTTSVTVRDRPSNVELIGQYVSNLNHNLSKQVLVKIQILDVALSNDYDYGINWQMIARAFHNSPFIINGNYGTPISIKALTPQAAGSAAGNYPLFGTKIGNPNQIPYWSILLNALSQQGKTSVVSEPRVVCLNNQVSVVRVVQQNGYVASIQNTSLAGSGSGGANTNIGTVTSQITPGTVITGLTLYILPKIMHDNVYMQVNADLSTNNGFDVFTGGGPSSTSSQIQLPNITEKHFNQRSMIRSGDTLILSGFRQVTNRANANQFLQSQALGGKGSEMLNTETIILITPIILSGSA